MPQAPPMCTVPVKCRLHYDDPSSGTFLPTLSVFSFAFLSCCAAGLAYPPSRSRKRRLQQRSSYTSTTLKPLPTAFPHWLVVAVGLYHHPVPPHWLCLSHICRERSVPAPAFTCSCAQWDSALADPAGRTLHAHFSSFVESATTYSHHTQASLVCLHCPSQVARRRLPRAICDTEDVEEQITSHENLERKGGRNGRASFGRSASFWGHSFTTTLH